MYNLADAKNVEKLYIEEPYLGIRTAYEQTKNLQRMLW